MAKLFKSGSHEAEKLIDDLINNTLNQQNNCAIRRQLIEQLARLTIDDQSIVSLYNQFVSSRDEQQKSKDVLVEAIKLLEPNSQDPLAHLINHSNAKGIDGVATKSIKQKIKAILIELLDAIIMNHYDKDCRLSMTMNEQANLAENNELFSKKRFGFDAPLEQRKQLLLVKNVFDFIDKEIRLLKQSSFISLIKGKPLSLSPNISNLCVGFFFYLNLYMLYVLP